MWRERSNFIIAARIPNGGEIETEQLWARQVAPRQFEICCIPFFVYDLALGDAVETDDEYIIKRVIAPSGRYVFRVWFKQSDDQLKVELVERLGELGADIEWSSLAWLRSTLPTLGELSTLPTTWRSWNRAVEWSTRPAGLDETP